MSTILWSHYYSILLTVLLTNWKIVIRIVNHIVNHIIDIPLSYIHIIPYQPPVQQNLLISLLSPRLSAMAPYGRRISWAILAILGLLLARRTNRRESTTCDLNTVIGHSYRQWAVYRFLIFAWWFLMIYDNVWWCLMIYDDILCIVMNYDDFIPMKHGDFPVRYNPKFESHIMPNPFLGYLDSLDAPIQAHTSHSWVTREIKSVIDLFVYKAALSTGWSTEGQPLKNPKVNHGKS